MSLERKNIANISAYIAGKPIEETKRELGLKEVVKLASNENPLGPCPKAIEAIKKNLSGINRYPDSNGFALKKGLADYLDVTPANIILGNGSDELIDIIIKSFVEEDESVVTGDTTFLEYGIISQVNNRKVIKTALKSFKFDLGAIKRAVNKKTKLVFIANPNNPTGTYVGKGELGDFIKGLPEHVILVLDEAYDVFIDVDDFPHSLEYIKKNVIVLKTFSKAYGLAGLRVGYAIAKPELISPMEKVRQPFNVNLLAQAGALAALADGKFLRLTREITLEGKYYLYKECEKLGLNYVPSVANFILINVGRDCLEVYKKMLKLGVIVRDMKLYGLDNFVRVSIGTKKENQKCVKALKRVLS